MIVFLAMMWWLGFILLTGYHLFIFRLRNKGPLAPSHLEQTGVSIVIAVKNGSDVLQKNMAVFLSQDYPAFEIIIVDDHSEESEKQKLKEMLHQGSNIFLYHNTSLPGKKQALSLGVGKAKYDYILCTDADCCPTGPMWIKSMMKHQQGDAMVLGFSPYLKSRGYLNLFIRFETLMTAIQYFSWAMTGRPYMGVGRNMLYTRDLFFKMDPYSSLENIPYGDDDLWVQKASSHITVNVNLEKESHVYSLPAFSWLTWLRQKHRHLSAGHFYDTASWFKPGLYALALIVHWCLLPVVIMATCNSWWLVAFIPGLAFRWLRHADWTSKLGERDTLFWYPVLELGYALYLAGMGLFTILSKKKTWI